MAAARLGSSDFFFFDFCTELSLHLGFTSAIQSPRFTIDYKFGISVNT